MQRRLAPILLALVLASPLAAASMAPPPGSVWTVLTTVEADVRENYATVKVIADIANRGPDPEFPFVVRIPDDAFVTGLIIERDGTVYEAQIKDRETAREEYEAWKAKEETGGLVEKTRRTSVYSYLINVAEFTNVRATLTYERYLAADRGIYELGLEAPVSGFGEDQGARFVVRVQDTAGVIGLWGDPAGRVDGDTLTYEVGPRRGVEFPTQFNASYMLGPTGDAGSLLTTIVDGQGYFAHRFRAPDDARQLPLDLVLVLDVSGSMSGLKIQQMIDAAKQVIQSLDDNDTLHLVAFSSDARSTWTGMVAMTPEERRRAARELDALFDGGGTNIEAGLRRGFDALSGLGASRADGRFPALVLLTDGQPTAGVTSHDGLRQIVRAANTLEVNVFTIAFGADADWRLMRAIADDGHGAAIRVPLGQGAEVDLRRFMSALTTPVLRNVVIEYGEGVEAQRNGAPVLFAGSELLVTGTFDPALGIAGNVTGISPEGARRYHFAGGTPGAMPFLPRLVAYHEVRAEEQDDAPDVARIKALALQHGFVTDHTSLVLTLPAREARPWTMDERAMADDAGRNGSTLSIAPRGAPTSAGLQYYDADSNAAGEPYGGTTSGTPAPTRTPTAAGEVSAQVPGPGVALLVVAAGVLALARRRA